MLAELEDFKKILFQSSVHHVVALLTTPRRWATDKAFSTFLLHFHLCPCLHNVPKFPTISLFLMSQ
jgi:hypothetical protein